MKNRRLFGLSLEAGKIWHNFEITNSSAASFLQTVGYFAGNLRLGRYLEESHSNSIAVRLKRLVGKACQVSKEEWQTRPSSDKVTLKRHWSPVGELCTCRKETETTQQRNSFAGELLQTRLVTRLSFRGSRQITHSEFEYYKTQRRLTPKSMIAALANEKMSKINFLQLSAEKENRFFLNEETTVKSISSARFERLVEIEKVSNRTNSATEFERRSQTTSRSV